MKIITNDKVSGFCSYDSEIIILDKLERPFYYFDNPSGRRVIFNLPIGEFICESNVKRLKSPLVYEVPQLPKPDKDIEIPELWYEVGDNPNKCSIDVATGKVFIDYSIDEQLLPFKNFVLFHEVGHFLYKGGIHEHYCDIFAASKMLEFGFNISQIDLAQDFCLSNRSIKRKEYLFNWLNNVIVYEPE